MSVHSHYRAGLWHPYEKPMYGVLLNPHHPLARGLVGCWLFNEGGGNIVYDLSGYGNHGTLGGDTLEYCPAWIIGDFGSALSFDGSNDYIDCGDDESLDITNAITIEAWIKTTQTEQGWILAKFGFDNTGGYGICVHWNKLQFTTKVGDTWDDLVSDQSINDGKLHCLVATYDGSTKALHIDGSSDKSKPYSGTLVSNSDPVFIGKSTTEWSDPLCGTISFSRLWNRGLSHDEIQKLYTNPFCMFYHPLEAEMLYAAAPPAGIVPQVMHHYRMLREV